MDFTDLVHNAISELSSYARAHPVVAGIAFVVGLLLLYRKTLTVLLILGLGLLLAGVLYMILEMGNAGVSTKERMIKKDNVPENIFRAAPIQLNTGSFGIPTRPGRQRVPEGFVFPD